MMKVLETKMSIPLTFIQLREKLIEMLIENHLFLEGKSNKIYMKVLQKKKVVLNDECGLKRMTMTQLGNPCPINTLG